MGLTPRMDDFLLAAMNQGFLVYEDGKSFIVKKIPTHANPNISITDDCVPDTSVVEFSSLGKAFDFIASKIGWEKWEGCIDFDCY